MSCAGVLFLTALLIPAPQQSSRFNVEGDFAYKELLSNPTAEGITLSVMPRVDLDLYVEYGLDSGGLNSRTRMLTAPPGKRCSISIKSLEPGRRYNYRLRYREVGAAAFGAGEQYSFRTLRESGSTVRFAFGADSHLYKNWANDVCSPRPTGSTAYFRKTIQNIMSWDPDFFITAGDEAMTHCLGCAPCTVDGLYAGANTVQSIEQARLRYRRIMQPDLYGAMTHSVPFFMALGNHDGEMAWGGANGFCEHYDATDPLSESARLDVLPNPYFTYSGSSTGNYFSFETGDVLIVVIDSHKTISDFPMVVEDWTLGQPQLAWLDQTLAASDKRWKVIVSPHIIGGQDGANCYYYGRGGVRSTVDGTPRSAFLGEQDAIHKLMVRHGVQAFLYGHDHVAVAGEKQNAAGEGEGVHYILGGQLALNASPWRGEPWFQNEMDWDEDGVADYDNGYSGSRSVGFYRVTVFGKDAMVFEYICSDPDDPAANNTVEFTYTIM
ncbi:MAG TPA: metallophosphoesterase [Planctomycetota bacterium]|nr:metallophosphoesterase [Planctomycetota bacterium]